MMELSQKGERRRAELAALTFALALMCSQILAADFQVTNTLDSGEGSLRWAISSANSTLGANTIICTNVSGVIALASPLPSLTGNTAILGPGAGSLAISGSNMFRVFQVAPGSTVSITGVTIANGFATNGGGAGILSAGNLTVADCAIIGNQSVSVPGGGILSQGPLVLRSSTIASNLAQGFTGPSFPGRDFRGLGGGLYFDGGVGTVSNCSFVANRASGGRNFDFASGQGSGGAVFVQSGAITLVGTSLSSNLARGGVGGGDLFVGRSGANAFGGAISSITGVPAGNLLVNCTISGNRSEGGGGSGGSHYGGDGGNAYGGGIFAGAGTISLVNCTVYQNVAVGGTGGPGGTTFPYHGGSPGFSSGSGIQSSGTVSVLNTILQSSVGAFNSQGYNLVESGYGITGLIASDQTNALFGLDTLNANGGSSLTHALLPNSPAIDAGTSDGAPPIDQRGIPRPQNFAVDIGAYEAEFGLPQIVALSSNQQVIASDDVSFAVRALSAIPMSAQWFHDGMILLDATNLTLAIRTTQTNDSGDYLVVLNNSFGSITSTPIHLAVLPLPPNITKTPTNQSVITGASVMFAVSASGSRPISFQWQFNGRNIPGATSSNLVLTQTSPCDAGIYAVVVKNPFGSVISMVARLSVTEPSPIVAWGRKDYGATVAPPDLSNVVDIAATCCTSIALRDDGTVVAWGRSDDGETNIPAGLTDVRAIAAGGGEHILALLRDGTVRAWGWNDWGQTDVPPDLTSVAAIAAGNCQSMALKSNGTVVVWGDCGSGTTNLPTGLSDVTGIAAGLSFCLALKRDGSVLAWGSETNVPAGLNNVVLIAARGYYGLALKNDGRIVAWGSFPSGGPTDPSVRALFARSVLAPIMFWHCGATALYSAGARMETVNSPRRPTFGTYRRLPQGTSIAWLSVGRSLHL